MTWHKQAYAIQNWVRLLLPPMALLIFLIAQPRPAYGHSVLPPTDQTLTILEDATSGPYRITASQYVANDFLVIEVQAEVQVAANGDELPAGTWAEATITSAHVEEPTTKRLLRHHNTFIARLPLTDESLQISLFLEGVAGEGSTEMATISYAAPEPASPLVRGLVIGTPFLLILVALAAYRYLGLAFVQ